VYPEGSIDRPDLTGAQSTLRKSSRSDARVIERMSLERSPQGSAFGRSRNRSTCSPSMISTLSPASDFISWSHPRRLDHERRWKRTAHLTGEAGVRDSLPVWSPTLK
jgi:hypothetical protein